MQNLLVTHIAISFAISLIVTIILKKKFETNTLLLFIALFIFNILLPILAHVISLFFLPVLALAKKKVYIHNVQTFDKNEFFKRPYPKINRIFGEGAIVSLTKDKDNYSPNKMKSLAFMSQNSTKQNNELIRELLSDNDNEIRLYSFAILNDKEKELNAVISKMLSKLKETKDDKNKASIYAEISSLYWEFIHFGLVTSESEIEIIKNVEKYAQKSLEIQPNNGKLILLLAKVNFKRRKYKSSYQFFKQALRLGINKSIVNPYLAELDFENREFGRVKKLLNEISPLETSFLTNPLYLQWKSL
jgi:hypothetical protein